MSEDHELYGIGPWRKVLWPALQPVSEWLCPYCKHRGLMEQLAQECYVCRKCLHYFDAFGVELEHMHVTGAWWEKAIGYVIVAIVCAMLWVLEMTTIYDRYYHWKRKRNLKKDGEIFDGRHPLR